jgi:hypothetical protein
LLKIPGLHIDDLTRGIITRIVDGQIQIGARSIKQFCDIAFARRIGDDCKRLSAISCDLVSNSFERCQRSTRDDDFQAIGRESRA